MIRRSKSYARAISKTQEVLVPIRLEIEWEMYKLRDTFTWNLAGMFRLFFAVHATSPVG